MNSLPTTQSSFHPADLRVSSDLAELQGALQLDRAELLELGCGQAEVVHALLDAYPQLRAVACEVDQQQLALLRSQPEHPRLTLERAGAESIPAADASFDVVVMLRSLHHVPRESMHAALSEVARVLRPGGHAWFAEPVYAGGLNDLLSIFHDEREVRQAALDAIEAAVERGALERVEQRFYGVERRFRDFNDFADRLIHVTHSEHDLDESTLARVRETFLDHQGPDGANFVSPVRVDHLRKA